MLDAVQPQHVVPAHEDPGGYSGYVTLAGTHGYEIGRDLHATSKRNVLQLA